MMGTQTEIYNEKASGRALLRGDELLLGKDLVH